MPLCQSPRAWRRAGWRPRRWGRATPTTPPPRTTTSAGQRTCPSILRHLERYELGTKYTAMVDGVKRLLPREPIRQRLPYTVLLIDKAGVGAAVADSF
jgi:hypothetical protein